MTWSANVLPIASSGMRGREPRPNRSGRALREGDGCVRATAVARELSRRGLDGLPGRGSLDADGERLALLAGAPERDVLAVDGHDSRAADRLPDLLAQRRVRDERFAVAAQQDGVAGREQADAVEPLAAAVVVEPQREGVRACDARPLGELAQVRRP